MLCIASSLVTGLLWLIGASSDHGGEIVFGYFAFLLFVLVSLPLHLIGIPRAIYTGVKIKNHAQLIWQYAYFLAWSILSVIIFCDFLFEEIPEMAEKALFSATHENEIELSRALQRQDADPARVRALIEAGADANQADQYFAFPPIIWAARQGNAEIVEMLLNAGADATVVVPTKANSGVMNEIYVPEVTAIGFAAVSQDDDQRRAVVDLLLAHGADPGRGLPVLGACAFGDIAALETLLEAGADINAADINNGTCAHFAAHNGRLDMLMYLEENGYLQEQRNDHDRAPIDMAAFRQQGEAVLLLMQLGHYARSDESIVRFLDQDPADTPVKNRIRALLVERGNDN